MINVPCNIEIWYNRFCELPLAPGGIGRCSFGGPGSPKESHRVNPCREQVQKATFELRPIKKGRDKIRAGQQDWSECCLLRVRFWCDGVAGGWGCGGGIWACSGYV